MERVRLFDLVALLRDSLLADEEVKKLVGDRVAPCMIDQGFGSYIILTRLEMEPEDGKSAMDVVTISGLITIDIYADSYQEAVSIAKVSYLCLKRQFDKWYNLPTAEQPLIPEFIGAGEGYSGGKYVQTLTYRFVV